MTAWTFRRKIGAGFALTLLLALAIGWIAVASLSAVVEAKDRVIDVTARTLIDAQRIETATASRIAATRGFILHGEDRYLTEIEEARAEFTRALDGMSERGSHTDILRAIRNSGEAYAAVSDRIIRAKQSGASNDLVQSRYLSDLGLKRKELQDTVGALIRTEEAALRRDADAASAAATSSQRVVMGIAFGALVLAILIAVGLTTTLTRQIGAAVGQVQTSSAELEAAANQQVTGSREQANAMKEITTTISELLATSRQIAESARSVSEMAGQTAGAAASGEGIVERTQVAIVAIQKQVERIVGHMLDLGKKSQQIGAVLDIVSELAEQTNILAINATIEANGAGEAGRRFGVVADEIRKLADRVSTSTREIRTLIEEIRGAVNTTVMATETGSKAAETGTQQFAEVTSSLREIAGLVTTTTQAAREIELSTKQQATAVEQVNVAIADVAQASKESETSSLQTLQTASQLTLLSRDLLRIIRPEAPR